MYLVLGNFTDVFLSNSRMFFLVGMVLTTGCAHTYTNYYSQPKGRNRPHLQDIAALTPAEARFVANPLCGLEGCEDLAIASPTHATLCLLGAIETSSHITLSHRTLWKRYGVDAARPYPCLESTLYSLVKSRLS